VQDDGIVEDQSYTDDSQSINIGYLVSDPFSGCPHWIEPSASTEDVSGWYFDAEADQIIPVPSVPEITITPPDSPVEVSLPMRGAIAPSPTPVAPLVPSIIPEELPASFSRRFPNSVGEDGAKMDDVDEEGEWTISGIPRS
jgi:hypothetical protein